MTASKAEKGRRARFDSLEQEVYLNLWRTFDRLRAIEDETFGRHGLTAQQYNALRLLRGRHPEPLPTLAIASRLISRAPDITRLLDRLEERSLILRDRPAENRRLVRVRITPAGLDLLKILDTEVRACHERQLGHLTPAELKSLAELLRAARHPHELSESDWR
jgi:DNA-binding MarR family transcriptional regulator